MGETLQHALSSQKVPPGEQVHKTSYTRTRMHAIAWHYND